MPGDEHYDKDHPNDGSGMAPRSCTDIFCLLLFLVFCSAMGYVNHFAIKHGNPQRLTHGFNYNGSLCGVDPEVKDRPLLYYCPTQDVAGVPLGLNLKAPVCVKACPTDANETIKCIAQSSAAVAPAGTANHPAQTVVLSQNVVDTVSYATTEVLGLYCIPDLERLQAVAKASGVPVPAGLRDSLFNSTGPIGKNSVKAQQYIGSLRRCTTLLAGAALLAVILGYAYLLLLKLFARPLIYLSFLFIILCCLAVSGFFFVGEIAFARPGPIAGNSTVAPPVDVSAGTTKSAAVIVVVKTTAAPVVAATPAPQAPPAPPAPVVSTTVAAARKLAVPTDRRLLTYEEACMRVPSACAEMQVRWEQYGGRKKWEELNPYYSEHMSLADAKTASLVTGGVFCVLALVFLLLLCCAHGSINTAVGCVEAATEAMFAMPCMLLMPLIEVIVKVAMLCVLLFFLMYLVSSGELDTKTYAQIGGQEVNGLRRHFKYTDETKGYIAFYVFGIFWFLELANAMGSFVVTYAVVGWYYTPKPKNHNWCGLVWGYIYACTFHLGTLAFGSLLIAICRFLRLILSVISQVSKDQGNAAVACIAKILICCITCFEKFMKFINKNAYIDVAINSNNFCGAAADVMAFIAGHPAEITILNGACTIFSIAGCSLVSGLTGYATYMACTTQPRWTDETSPHHVASPRFVAIVAAVGAIFIAHAFMQIFDHTADTLLYTYCWNKSKAHNTVQKYAPDGLSKLVGYAPLAKPAPAAAAAAAPPAKGWFASVFGGGENGNSSERKPLIG